MKIGRVFWGIILILAAAALIIGKLGYFGEINIFSLLATVALVLIIIRSVYPLHFSGILFPLAFLCMIYDEQLGIESLTPWTVLIVALLGSIGLSMLFDNKSRWVFAKGHASWEPDFEQIDVEDESYITQKTSFGASTKYINSDDFKMASFDCSFGAMKVYFDNAKSPDGQAIVKIHVNCAGMELYVPKEWAVSNKMSMSLGAVEEKNHNSPDGSMTLILTGSGSLSGIEITYI